MLFTATVAGRTQFAATYATPAENRNMSKVAHLQKIDEKQEETNRKKHGIRKYFA